MQQDSLRAPSGRYHPHGTDESHLPGSLRHDARQVEDAEDATHDHPSALSDTGKRHQDLRRDAELRETAETLSETGSHRTDIKQVYERMEALNPEVRYNIWGALEADNKLIEEP